MCVYVCVCVCVVCITYAGKGRLKSSLRRVGYGSGAGVAFPPLLPPSPWCRGATEGLAPCGQVSSPSGRPWPRPRSPGRPVDAESAPDICEAIGGGGGTCLPSRTACAVAHPPPPAIGANRGCPLWCRVQQCRTPLCPQHNLHTGACVRHTASAWALLPHPPRPRLLRQQWQGQGGGGVNKRPWCVAGPLRPLEGAEEGVEVEVEVARRPRSPPPLCLPGAPSLSLAARRGRGGGVGWLRRGLGQRAPNSGNSVAHGEAQVPPHRCGGGGGDNSAALPAPTTPSH